MKINKIVGVVIGGLLLLPFLRKARAAGPGAGPGISKVTVGSFFYYSDRLGITAKLNNGGLVKYMSSVLFIGFNMVNHESVPVEVSYRMVTENPEGIPQVQVLTTAFDQHQNSYKQPMLVPPGTSKLFFPWQPDRSYYTATATIKIGETVLDEKSIQFDVSTGSTR